ncbi:MAG: hypothetical protein LBV79_01975 [Candidatus Adiutrix sp.]|nr:hypothetical protein [Candidatus Adiutrix sp.]
MAPAQDFAYRREVPAMTGQAVVPLVTMGHWKESKPNERYAFLVGLVTMLEIEKEWQLKSGKKLMPMKQSLTGSWVRGFEDLPLKEMYDGLNRYVVEHPGDLERPVAEVLWFSFVQPKLAK